MDLHKILKNRPTTATESNDLQDALKIWSRIEDTITRNRFDRAKKDAERKFLEILDILKELSHKKEITQHQGLVYVDPYVTPNGGPSDLRNVHSIYDKAIRIGVMRYNESDPELNVSMYIDTKGDAYLRVRMPDKCPTRHIGLPMTPQRSALFSALQIVMLLAAYQQDPKSDWGTIREILHGDADGDGMSKSNPPTSPGGFTPRTEPSTVGPVRFDDGDTNKDSEEAALLDWFEMLRQGMVRYV